MSDQQPIELRPEHHFPIYANSVQVGNMQKGEIVLTFLYQQPRQDETIPAAKSVARVALPAFVADAMCRLIFANLKIQEGGQQPPGSPGRF